MKVDAATKQDVRYVAERMRDRDVEEFLAVSRLSGRDALVEAIVGRYGEHDDVIVACDEEPIAVGGLIHHRPHVGTLMFFATPALHTIGSDLTRFIKKSLFPGYTLRGTHRIECASIAGYDETHRWLEVLGLHQEAVMPGYGRDGQTFLQFAWVADGRNRPVRVA